MREIKFRQAIFIGEKFDRFEYFGFVDGGFTGITTGPNCGIEDAKKNSSQYTGLKDKNGKEIYEGDIVKWDDGSNGLYWRVCEIEWEPSHYVLNGFSFNSSNPSVKKPVSFSFGAFIYESDGELEVIGNIYENPELLKSSKD